MCLCRVRRNHVFYILNYFLKPLLGLGIAASKLRPRGDPILTPVHSFSYEFTLSQLFIFQVLLHNLLKETNLYWSSWIRKSTYQGSWKEAVHRSALALKLLIFEPTGAIVASPTFSLPEFIGGTRNWDYRYALL